MTAELRITQAATQAEIGLDGATYITQATALTEIGAAGVYVTQAVALVEIGNVTGDPDTEIALHITQAAALVEIGIDALWVTQAAALIEIDLHQYYKSDGTTAEVSTARPVSSAVRAQLEATAKARAAGMQAAMVGRQMQFSAPQPAAAAVAAGLAETVIVAAKVMIDWDRDGVYSDETVNLISCRGESRLVAPEQSLTGGGGQTDQCLIVLHNGSARYSARNSGSAIYSSIANGNAYQAPVRVSVIADGTEYRIFTGVIRRITESMATPTQAPTVTLDCRSRDDLLLQRKQSTTWSDFATSIDNQHTEDWHIVKLLEAAGMVDGVDFVSRAYAAAHPGTRHTIDPGLTPIPFVWLDDESVLEEIWQIAAAACGWFYCDADGVFHYHNRAGFIASQLAQHYGAQTTLALDEAAVAGLSLSYRESDLYNEITVETSPRAPGATEEVWAPDDAIVLQPAQTLSIWARLSAPVARYTGLTWTAYNAAGVNISANLSLTASYYAQRVKLTFTNNGTQTAYIRKVSITGVPLLGSKSVETTAKSSATFWNGKAARNRSIRNNPYVQTLSHADMLARYVLARQEKPALTADVRNVDQAAVRVGRPVSLTWPATMTAGALSGMVVALSWNLDQSGFRQQATIMDTASIFAACAPFFKIGTNRLGATGPDIAKLFW